MQTNQNVLPRYLVLSYEIKTKLPMELELELIQIQITQKPMLQGEVYAHAMRASQNYE